MLDKFERQYPRVWVLLGTRVWNGGASFGVWRFRARFTGSHLVRFAKGVSKFARKGKKA